MLENFTRKAIKTINLAGNEAVRLGQDSIREEHILIALEYEGTNIGAKTMRAFGGQRKDLRGECEKIGGRGQGTRGFEILFSREAEEVLARSKIHAAELGQDVAGTGHLMLALIDDKRAPATHILRTIGIDTRALGAEISRLLQSTNEI